MKKKVKPVGEPIRVRDEIYITLGSDGGVYELSSFKARNVPYLFLCKEEVRLVAMHAKAEAKIRRDKNMDDIEHKLNLSNRIATNTSYAIRFEFGTATEYHFGCQVFNAQEVLDMLKALKVRC